MFFFCYNHIKIDPTDEVHTSFITIFDTYYCKVMLFSVKNASETFQRMVTEVFKPRIGQTMEVYVNDMIVKNEVAANHLFDLRETFDKLWFY